MKSLLLFFSLLPLLTHSQSPPPYVPTYGLVAFYPLSQSAKGFDVSGKNGAGILKGQYRNDLDPARDRFGDSTGAMGFEAFRSSLTIDLQQIAWAAGFSIGGWYKTEAPDYGNEQPIIAKHISEGKYAIAVGYGPGVHNCSFLLLGDSVNQIVSPDDPLLSREWHFVAGTFNGREMQLYIDGKFISALRPSSEFLRQFAHNVSLPLPVRIGAHASGSMDDVFIYNRALTAEEVSRLFESGTNKASFLQKSGFTIGFHDLGNGNSLYPKISSPSRPLAAEAINKALQIADFNGILTPKNPGALGSPAWWRYYVEMPTNRLLIIHTIAIVIDWGRRDSPSVERHYRYYFDAQTGDQLFLRDFFTPDGYRKMGASVSDGLRKSMNTMINSDMTNDENGCANYVNGMWTAETVRFTINPYNRRFLFDINDCGEQDPSGRDHYLFDTSVAWKDVIPNLSPQGLYYVDNGPAFPVSTLSHTWRGVLGQNIHVTFSLREDERHAVNGREVYDSYGATIPIKGSYLNGVFTLSELDAKGQALATYEGKLEGRKLVGSWKKADGSKTLPFVAVIAGER